MAFTFLQKRWQKITLGILATLGIIVLVIPLFVNLYWSPVLARKVKNTVISSTDSLYSVNFSDASLHFLRGQIEIDHIELRPNMAVYERRKKQHLAPNSLYTLNISKLVIDHVHPLMLRFDRKLDIAQIVISKPDLRVDYEQNRDQDTVIQNNKTPYQLISKVLRSIHVQNIVLKDVKFKYIDHSGSKPDVMEIDQLNFTATEFLLDSLSQKDRSRFLFCKDISTELDNYEGTTADQRYHYKIDNLTFSTGNSQVNMTGMSFLPVKPPTEFLKTTKNDCYAIKLDSLQMNDFDFRLYSKYHQIHASSLTLSNSDVHVFDNPIPSDTTADRSGNFPHVVLARSRTDIQVDTIRINRSNISYTEYNPKSDQYGTVSFANTNGSFFNVTNNKAALQKNNNVTAKLYTYLMNNGRMDVQFAFNLVADNAPFAFKGHMQPMDLKKINPVAAPLGLVKVASGKLKSLDFDMRADKRAAKGNVLLLYNDLKISVLKKDDENKLKRMGIMSLLANAMVIKRNNPDQGEPARAFKVTYMRKKSQSIFTLMWKSIFVGIKSCAGYDAATENTVKQKISDFKNGKADRQAKKAIRKQHRAERRQRRQIRKQEKELRKQQEQQIPL